jgi:DNA-directed RNA polymerase specialized sigma24 family protein
MAASQSQPDTSPESEYASAKEAAIAIAGLSTKDKATLRKMARSWWDQRMSGPNAGSDPDDLLQEAIVRTLQHSRKWRKSGPRSVTIVKHLIRTMESISWQSLKVRKAQPHGWAEDSVDEIDPGDRPGGAAGSIVEDVVFAREEFAQLESLFEHDKEALEVLRCRSLELSPSETCARLGIERSRYDTVNKRIWRKLTNNN